MKGQREVGGAVWHTDSPQSLMGQCGGPQQWTPGPGGQPHCVVRVRETMVGNQRGQSPQQSTQQTKGKGPWLPPHHVSSARLAENTSKALRLGADAHRQGVCQDKLSRKTSFRLDAAHHLSGHGGTECAETRAVCPVRQSPDDALACPARWPQPPRHSSKDASVPSKPICVLSV